MNQLGLKAILCYKNHKMRQINSIQKILNLVTLCPLFSVLKIIGCKNACAFEFACILGRNNKCSVIILPFIFHIAMFSAMNARGYV